jgi:ribosomal protein S18 acetylase RimI-like enzyme
MAAPFYIRPVTRDEAPAWIALRLEALKAHPTAFTSSFEEFSQLSVGEQAARIPQAGGADVLFGVFVGEALCGSAGFARETQLKSRHKGVLWGVYLQPPLRGTGAGEALVGRVIEHARTQVDILLCAVSADNLGPKALYHRMGFRTYGVEPRCLRHEGRDYDEEMMVMEFA